MPVKNIVKTVPIVTLASIYIIFINNNIKAIIKSTSQKVRFIKASEET